MKMHDIELYHGISLTMHTVTVSTGHSYYKLVSYLQDYQGVGRGLEGRERSFWKDHLSELTTYLASSQRDEQ